MSKICTSNCVINDERDSVRANYGKLYKWPEADAEFVRSAVDRRGARQRSRVVDSISCRQMYLRSYKFSRKKETVPEKTMKCFARVKSRVAAAGRKTVEEMALRRGVVVIRRERRFSCGALCAVFRRMLFCATSVDVVA